MSIYWYAYNEYEKKYFYSPTNYAGNGCIKPNNPFPQMIVMMKMRGHHYEVVNDVSWEHPNGCIDVTQEVYEDYLKLFPWAKEYYDKEQV